MVNAVNGFHCTLLELCTQYSPHSMRKYSSLLTSLAFLVSFLSVPLVHAQDAESPPAAEEAIAEPSPVPEKMSKGDRTKTRGLRFQDQAMKKSRKIDVFAEKRKAKIQEKSPDAEKAAKRMEKVDVQAAKMKGTVQKRTDMKMQKLENKVQKRRGGGGGGGY